MTRTRPRQDRQLELFIEHCVQEDLASAARWDAEHKIKFDEYATWYRISGGDLVRSLAGSGRARFVILLDGPAGWFISDNLGNTFAPQDPLPPEFQGRARRHGKQVFFDSEESARLAAHALPGYWSS